MLEYYHDKKTLMMLCDGLDECAHVKPYIQQYLANELTKQAARVVISSRLAGFSDRKTAGPPPPAPVPAQALAHRRRRRRCCHCR